MKVMRIMAAAAALLAATQAAASDDTDARISELMSRYIEGEGPAVRETIVSDDEAVRSGDWSGLAAKYPMPDAAEQVEAPSPDHLAAWWNTFGDDTMRDMIYMALSKNRSLAAARARVTEARAALGMSRSALLPWLDATGSWTNGDPSTRGTQASLGAFDLYKLGIDASWEIDIFGGRQAQVDAAASDLASAHAALHAAWVSLSSEVALNYVSLCVLYARMATVTENIRIQQETLDMLESKYESGLADALALEQSRYTVAQTRAALPPLRTNIEMTKNALAILLGETPGSIDGLLGPRRPIPRPSADTVIGIPAEGLRKRPDIRAAEMQFIAQTARTRSARADLYPKFRLIGSIGYESFDSGSLIKEGSRGFSIGPSISLPIFHAGAIRRNIRVQTAREEQLLAAYEETVLAAVAEVRNALTAHEQETVRIASLRAGVESARAALEVANDKYNNGLTEFTNVLSAQTALLSLQDQEAESLGAIASDIIRLYKALGGGWEPMVEEEMGAAER